MSVEHASERLIGRYARGDTGISGDEIWALEAHLEACAVCRARLSAVAEERAPAVTALVDGVWAELGPLLPDIAPMPPRRRWAPALSAWASPVMVPWLCMAAFVALLAVVFDITAGRSGGHPGEEISGVLLVAPVLPVLGVAASWARGIDPSYELTAATPRAGLELVLRRTASVLVVVICLLLVAGGLTGTTVALWLLPCLAFTAGTLALGGLIGVTRAAVALVAVWAAVIVTPTVALSRMSFALRTDSLPVWGAVLALGVAVVIARRGAYTLLGAHH
ncbi:zf-HC2 domain-containing protein [Streptomyces sp. AK02-01A]|uniref:zf-HC2 domain-containing protein n=1 Tax=Streptomyces sp. AK02-01A TaxID=3028648 RepID=UPI0029BC7831|nr:zf-HC2 domain-containing protein [Streptomyces sp. AK02-01A]MDX3855638.1 zf-HC2 domain-containing protein [Streptomyces sp. AK02-01A]